MTSPEQNNLPYDTLNLCQTHAGGRDYNQDCCGSTKTDTPAGTFLIVCDGVGGGQGGERASETAVTTILEAVKQSQGSTEADCKKTLETALETAHKAIQDVALNEDLAGMATTAAAVWRVNNARALVVHLGDSRVYHCRKRGKKVSTTLITEDHSHVNELIKKGIVDKSEAKTHPSSHTITRALGFGSSIHPDFEAIDLEKGDRIVVCSDGIWNLLEDEELAKLTYSGASVEDALKALVEEVHTRGKASNTKYDNLTVGILDCAAAPEPTRFSGFKAVWEKPLARVFIILAALLLVAMIIAAFVFPIKTSAQTTKGGQTETNPKKLSPKDIEALGKYLQKKTKPASPSAKDSAKSAQQRANQPKSNQPKINLSYYSIDPDEVNVLERIMVSSREDVEKFARETKFQDSSSQAYLKYLAVRYEQFLKEGGDYSRIYLEIDNGAAYDHQAVFLPFIGILIYKKNNGEERIGHRIYVQTGHKDYRSKKFRLRDGSGTHHNANAKFTDTLK